MASISRSRTMYGSGPPTGYEVALGRRAKVPQPERERPRAERARAQVILELAHLTTLERRLHPGRVLSEDGLSLLGPHASSTADGSRRRRRSMLPIACPPNAAVIVARLEPMGLLRRLARLIWGDDVDPAIRPVLGVNLVSSLAGSAMWSFMAIWAIEELDAKQELPFTFLVGALLAGASGFLGGYLSDRIGRRRVILIGQGIMVCYPVVLLALSGSKWAGLAALSLAGVFGSLGGSTSQAMVADLVAPDRREAAYASVRVASNLGVVAGPPIGGLVLLIASWPALFPTVAVLSGIAFFVASAISPTAATSHRRGHRSGVAERHLPRPALPPLPRLSGLRVARVRRLRDRPSGLSRGRVGYEPAAWGFLVWINPLLVTLFQLRLTRATAFVSPAPKLVTALLVMGLPYLLLVYSQGGVGGHRGCRHLRHRRDALGTDLPGRRGIARSQRHSWCVHGRVRERPRDRVRTLAPDRASGPKQLRGRCDLDDVRLPRGRRGRPRGSRIGDRPPTGRAADGLGDLERASGHQPRRRMTTSSPGPGNARTRRAAPGRLPDPC